MSHIVQIQTQVDPVAIAAACQRLGLAPPQNETVKLFSSTETGLAIRLNGWRYPVVCDPARGSLKYDSFNGRWGNQQELDRFLQAYAVEKTKLESRRKGHSVTEQPLQDGSIKLTIQVTGGASSNKTIEVIVQPNGGTKIETKAFVGAACKQASQFLEAALGLRSGEQLTAEYHQQASQQQPLQQGGST